MHTKKVNERIKNIEGSYSPSFYFKTDGDLNKFLESNNFINWDPEREQDGHTYVQNDLVKAYYLKENSNVISDLRTKYAMGTFIKSGKLSTTYLRLVPNTYLKLNVTGLTKEEKQLYAVLYMQIIFDLDINEYKIFISANKSVVVISK